MTFNHRELSTVLAALRKYQSLPLFSTDPVFDIATDGGTIEPMSDEEIDELCERINTQEATQ